MNRNRHSEQLSVETSIRKLAPRGETSGGDDMKMGVVYETLISRDSDIVRAKLALTEGGSHDGLVDTLHEEGLIRHIPRADGYLYAFPVEMIYFADQLPEEEHLAVRMLLATKALMLVNELYTHVADGESIVWNSHQLSQVDIAHIHFQKGALFHPDSQ